MLRSVDDAFRHSWQLCNHLLRRHQAHTAYEHQYGDECCIIRLVHSQEMIVGAKIRIFFVVYVVANKKMCIFAYATLKEHNKEQHIRNEETFIR